MGLISGLFGMTGGGDVDAPNVAQVGADYQGLLKAYQAGTPGLYDLQAEYQPKYSDLNLSEVNRLAPAMLKLLREANPEQAALLAKLTSAAGEGDMAYGGQLPPGMLRQSQQLTRAGQAARGMGYGPADMYQETGNALRLSKDVTDSNRGFALNAAQAGYQFETDPWLRMLGGVTGRAAGSLLSPANSVGLINTVYQGQANAATSSAANKTSAMNNSSQGFDSMFTF